MPWPTDQLDITIELALGADLADPGSWVWTDITQWTEYHRVKPVISRGRDDEQGTATTGRLSITVNNADGRFSRRNPSSPWYGLLNRGTPIRLSVNWGAGSVVRFVGYIAELPPRWGAGLIDQWVEITASGLLRSLERSDTAASPLRAAIDASTPVAYWPLEDAEGSEVGASAISGDPPIRHVAVAAHGYAAQVPHYGAVDGPAGSAPTPRIPMGYLGLLATPRTGSAQWMVHVAVKVETSATAALTTQPLTIHCETGTVRRLQVLMQPASVSVSAYNASGTISFASVNPLPFNPFNGEWHYLTVSARQSGANVVLSVDWDGIADSATLSGHTLGTVGRIYTPDYDLVTEAITSRSSAHLAVWDRILPAADLTALRWAAAGHPGEPAADRMARVCAEEGIPLVITEGSEPSEPMGPQPIAKALDILRDCETTDGGVLYETLDGGIGYLARSYFYDKATTGAVDLSLALSEVDADFAAEDDDQKLANDVVVSRPTGVKARAVDAASVASQGRYAITESINLASDARAPDAAAWRLHEGTIDEQRYPRITLNLRRDADLINAWISAGLGGRISVAPPPGMPPDPTDLIIEGYTELIDGPEWRATINASPASAWRVGRADSDAFGRADTAGSRLHSPVDADDTALVATTVDGPEWITTADRPTEFPFDVRMSGERVTVTGIAPYAADTFDRTGTAGWGTADTGQGWATSGGSPGDYSVASGTGLHSCGVVDSARITLLDVDLDVVDMCWDSATPVVASGSQIVSELVTHWTGTGDHYRWEVGYQPSGVVDVRIRRLIAGSGSVIASAANARPYASATPIRCRCRAVNGDLRMKVWLTTDPEPPSWDIVVNDTTHTHGQIGFLSLLAGGNSNTLPVVIPYDNLKSLTPQTFSVSRSENTVVKAHPAGTALSLWIPAIYGM